MKGKQERKQQGLVTLFVCKGGDFMENETEKKKEVLIAFISQANSKDIEKIIDCMEENGIFIETPELSSDDKAFLVGKYYNEESTEDFNSVVKELLEKIEYRIIISNLFLLLGRLLASFANKRTKLIDALVKIPKHYYKEVDYPKRYSVYVL